MMGTNGVVLFSLLIYAALLYGAVRLIKYFIRYGIDYYFEKLAENQHRITVRPQSVVLLLGK